MDRLLLFHVEAEAGALRLVPAGLLAVNGRCPRHPKRRWPIVASVGGICFRGHGEQGSLSQHPGSFLRAENSYDAILSVKARLNLHFTGPHASNRFRQKRDSRTFELPDVQLLQNGKLRAEFFDHRAIGLEHLLGFHPDLENFTENPHERDEVVIRAAPYRLKPVWTVRQLLHSIENPDGQRLAALRT
ncbi:MAG TPA: hypothetical protein VN300_12065 [Desulfobacterales bacterium]|nr:hypothetical protein [Desulfobacterales bacterium]